MDPKTDLNSDKILTKAPIVVAIAQLRYSLKKEFQVTGFLKNKASIIRDFPEIQTNVVGQLKFQDIIEGKTSASLQDPKKSGYRFISDDKSTSFSIELDKFTFDNKGKYNSWKSFFRNVMKCWNYFSHFHEIIEIRGVSLRFINEIPIYHDFDNPLDFFNYTVLVNEEAKLPSIDSYFLNFTYPWSDGHKKFVHFSHKVREINEKEFMAIIDIDVHNQEPIISYDEKQLVDTFEEVHSEVKKRFINSISLKLYEELL